MIEDKKIVSINNLKKSFGKKQVLKGINLDIKEGESLSIIGTNGSGKSVLLKSILGLLNTNEGSIDYPKHGNLKDFLKNVGIQYQDSELPNSYRVREIINLVYGIEKRPTLKEYKDDYISNRDSEVDKSLKFFGLYNYANSKVKVLSGGQKQRLNILLSLITKPNILFLDELTTGLDIKAKISLLEYIKEYQVKNNITLVIVSHIAIEIDNLSNRVLHLDNGVIMSDEKISDIRKKYKTLDNYLIDKFKPSEVSIDD